MQSISGCIDNDPEPWMRKLLASPPDTLSWIVMCLPSAAREEAGSNQEGPRRLSPTLLTRMSTHHPHQHHDGEEEIAPSEPGAMSAP